MVKPSGRIPSGPAHRSCDSIRAKTASHAGSQTWQCITTVTASEAWHCEKLEETIGEGAASIAVKAPGLKGS